MNSGKMVNAKLDRYKGNTAGTKRDKAADDNTL